jgi:hypothetical protein
MRRHIILPWQRRVARHDTYGVYFIFKSMEQGPSFRVSVPKYATKDPNYRILARQRSRFTHYYFYIRDAVLGPIVMRVASFFPFQTTYYLNGHSFIEQELKRAQIGLALDRSCRRPCGSTGRVRCLAGQLAGQSSGQCDRRSIAGDLRSRSH